MSIQVLGFWWWWLFVVPSLRSRRPKGFEKKALDIAFLATPVISLIAPVATKDTGLIWFGTFLSGDDIVLHSLELTTYPLVTHTFSTGTSANFAVVVGSYAFAYVTDNDDTDDDDGSKQPEWLKFLYKSLDFGTGKERGARQ